MCFKQSFSMKYEGNQLQISYFFFNFDEHNISRMPNSPFKNGSVGLKFTLSDSNEIVIVRFDIYNKFYMVLFKIITLNLSRH